MFVDVATIHVKGGRGGDGCLSFRREKYVPRGGPDGGDGGDGGHVVLRSDAGVHTLLDYRYRHSYQAEKGGHGLGKKKHGRRGGNVSLRVPVGTVVKDAKTQRILKDMTREGEEVIVAKGGKGGRGNARFATSVDRAPRRFERGESGEEVALQLELKLLADVGLVGQPNVGKSTLLARLSAAKPKIADYPFTTKRPNLGVVRLGEFDSFVLADIPGLVEGAHTGRGMGFQFLRHIERTRLIVYVLQATSSSPHEDYRSLREELFLFNPQLAHRPGIIVINKMDLLGGELENTAWGIPVCRISALTGQGIDDLLRLIEERLSVLRGEIKDEI